MNSKGRRKSPEQVDVAALLRELGKRPERPIQAMTEDSASLEGLIDLLVCKGIMTEPEFGRYLNRYQSAMTALVMLLIEKDVISETDMEKAISVYHFMVRTAHPGTKSEDVLEARRARLKLLLEV